MPTRKGATADARMVFLITKQMNNKQKADLLRSRHIKILIEWGGVKDMFTDVSDMTDDGVSEFLSILSSKNKDDINKNLTKLIQKEYDRR